MGECQKTTLANGLRILTTTMPHTRSVSVGFYLGVGSRYESDEEAGAAHYIEHMLFKGTERRPTPGAIASEIEGRGGVFNAQTGREVTHYWARVAHPHLGAALEVLCDMLRHSLFTLPEVERERRIIVEELNMTLDQPESLASLLINQLSWPNHPLGRDIAGTKTSIAALQRDELLAFQRRFYSPPNMVVSVAGAAEHEAVVQALAPLLGDWQGSPARRYVPAPAPQAYPVAKRKFKDTEQAHVLLRVPGLARSHPDRFGLTLLNTILGVGMSSRLFLELRERLGLAYAVDSSTAFLADTGVLESYAALEPAQAEATIRAILCQWKRVREKPVETAELERAKEFTKGRLLLGLEGSMAVAGWWGEQELLQGEALTGDQVISLVDAVTVDDLQRLAQQCFVGQRLSLATVGPLPDETCLHSLLAEAQDLLPQN
jgi:predicted Zn-dependent peptidase